LELRSVTFAYQNRKNTLIYKHYSLTIPSGKTVALVGASDCGKSTAIALIERFYDPWKGQVLLDGHDFRDLNFTWLCEHISLVSQELLLFMGTITENIAGGKPGATREDIVRAAQMANAHDFIQAFPQQYDTSVGDRVRSCLAVKSNVSR
jgi:ABC-type multidrug transport system fused ATPase/permease subunit